MKTKQVCYMLGLLLAMVLSSQAQTAATITKQPTNQVVSVGANVTFSVTATGTPPLNYQWRHEETNIESGTTRTLTLTNVQLVHQGRYDVVVSSLSGSVTSQVATLTVDPTFTKITTGRLVTDVEPSEPAIWWDYDNDGWMDVFVPNFSGNSSVYHNNGDGTFTKVSNPISTHAGASLAAAVGDYNNDGYNDLFVVQTDGADDLYRNDGGGNFTRLTKAQAGPPVGDADNSGDAAWADYDRDGFIDLFVVNSYFRAANDALYHNNGNGSFTKMTTNQVGMLVGDGATNGPCAWADYDNDGWPDLWVGTALFDFQPASGRHSLYHNNQDGTFSRVEPGSLAQNVATGGGVWGDYDNDGYLDLFMTGFEGPNSLHRNLAGQSFTNVAEKAGLTPARGLFEAAWGDYDNDGYLDLVALAWLAPNLSVLYHNNGDGTFASVDVGSPIRDGDSRIGSAWADYDNDGFLDLLVSCGDGALQPNFVYHNNGNANHWLKVKLTGAASNRSAIGAKVRVNATIRGKSFWQMREISGNSGIGGGANGLLAHFGLGDATNVDIVRIEWPSGNVQELIDVNPDQLLTIQEVVNITPVNPSSSLNGSVTLTRTPAVSGSYQWQFNGADLAGQTTRTLSLTNLQSNQKGRYSVVVTTAAQTVTNYVYLLVDTTFTKITDGPLVTDLGDSWNGAVGDYNGDGYLDIFVGRYRQGRSALYQNNGDGTFRSIANTTFPLPVGDYYSGPSSDFDNDGRVDLFVLGNNGATPSLFFYNNGDGTFAKVPLATLSPWSMNAVDYDHDGLLDLYCTQGGGSGNRLFRNLGGRSFQAQTSAQVGAILGVSTGAGAAWADYDDDGWEDLVALNPAARRCRLYRNTGTGRFESVTNQVSQAVIDALVAAWGDYDNDGRVDLCVAGAGGQTESAVYRNLGGGNFERASIGITIEGVYNFASWGDYDNDGFLDLFMTSYDTSHGNSLFRNNGNGTFTAITTGSIVNDRVTLYASYEGLWFDYDNDGFLDLLVPNGNDEGTAMAPNYLYHNNGNANAWLKVKLVGTTSNREGAGAKVRAQAKYAGATRWQRRDVTSGGAFDGMGPIAHFGLGDATNVTTLRIEWPSGILQEFTDVATKQMLTVTEPPRLTVVGPASFRIECWKGQSFEVQGSVDLKQWKPLVTLTNVSGELVYADPDMSTLPWRFYRVVTK